MPFPPFFFNLIAYQLQLSSLYTCGCRAQWTYQESHYWSKLMLLPLEAKAVQSTSVRGGASDCMLDRWLPWLCAGNHSCCAFMRGGQGPLPTGLSSQPKIILCKFFFLPSFLFMAPYFSILKFFCFTDIPSMNYPHHIILHPFSPVIIFLFRVSDLRKKTPGCFFLYLFPNTEFMFRELDTLLGLKD